MENIKMDIKTYNALIEDGHSHASASQVLFDQYTYITTMLKALG